MARYETPNALRSDARTLVQDARDLIDATSQVADEKVASARRRLSEALDQGKSLYSGMQSRVVERARMANEHVHENPYKSMAIAAGVGAIIGLLISRRE